MFMTAMWGGHPLIQWIGFSVLVMAMLAIDLGFFHKKAHAESLKEAGLWSLVWISTALVFNAWVFHSFGHQKGMEFLAGYLIEKALSVDNLFVFIAIFSFFAVEPRYQHRVLFWGILGALALRAVFIFAGLALIERFQWISYLLGLLLIYSGVKFLKEENEGEMQADESALVKLFRKFIPMTADYRGQSFFVHEKGRFLATPLLLVLVVVEFTDVVFALDSVPAVMAVSRDPFVVYTSNVFAILGLRALYFVLAGIMPMFVYLKQALCAILVFVGIKMIVHHYWNIPISLSLGFIASCLILAIGLSMLHNNRKASL